jgi:DNA-binding SARP family transcriptional activator
VRFGVLGPVVAHADNREITLKGPKQIALLAVLLSRPNTPIPVDTLADSLWGSSPPPSAHDGVRWHLHQLRRSLGEPDRVTRTHKGYLMHVLDQELDALVFEVDLLNATRALLDGRTDCARETLVHALDLWRGTPYEGLPSDAELHVRPSATRLMDMRVDAVIQECDLSLAQGDFAGAIRRLRPEIQADPLQEAMQARLVLALYRVGSRAEAVVAYRDAQRALREDLGIGVSRELLAVGEELFAGDNPTRDDPVLGRTTVVPTVAKPRPAELPRRGRVLIGRGRSGERIVKAARRGARVLVVHGPAGAGKSTLAIDVGHRLAADFPDGQIYINALGPEPARATPMSPRAIALHALRSLDIGEVPADLADDEIAGLFRSVVASRKLLVVVDNASSEEQLQMVLPGTENTCVLATSTRRLGPLDGAFHQRVGHLSKSDSVVALVSLTGDAALGLESVVKLSELCDGLPLALAVVAARLVTRRRLSPARLLARMKDPRSRLSELEHETMSVRTSLVASHRDLLARPRGRAAANLLTELSRTRTTQIKLAGLSTLLGRRTPDVDLLIEALEEAELLEPDRQDTFRIRPLVKLFARELLLTEGRGRLMAT